MLNPSVDELLKIVDSKYKLVHVISMRSKDILENNRLQMKESSYINKKAIGRAMEEIEKNLIKINEIAWFKRKIMVK